MTSNRKAIVLLILGILVFQIGRLALWLTYRSTTFADIDSRELIRAALHGLRFDFAAALYLFTLPVIAIVLPWKWWTHSRWAQELLGWAAFLILCCTILLVAGDLLYFDFVRRHVADELLTVRQDWQMFIGLARTGYLKYVGGFGALVFLSGLFWWRFNRRPLAVPMFSYIGFVVWLVVIVVGMRGGLYLKPISPIDAFISDRPALGQLVLNGVFSAVQASVSAGEGMQIDFDPMRAKAGARRLGFDPDAQYPFLTDATGGVGKLRDVNVVILLLESWSSFYVDSFGGQQFAVTPNFDRLAAEGLAFDQFFANGERSIEGIQLILTGIPAIKGNPTLGSGLELMEIPRIGDELRKGGYRSVFIQSSARQSFRMDSVARALGFDEYFGREDAPPQLAYPDPSAPAFGWDFETLMLLKKRLDAAPGKFFAFAFTGTTHTPFAPLPSRFLKYDHGPEEEGGFLNTLHYSDWSLGEFFRAASTAPWFDQTVFIMTADHTLGAYRSFDYAARHRVPLVIYAPKLLKPRRDARRVASHADILPTVLDLAGRSGKLPSIGRSLMSGGSDWALISGRFDWPGMIRDGGAVRHSLNRRIEARSLDPKCGKPCLDTTEEELVGLSALILDRIRTNRWMPGK